MERNQIIDSLINASAAETSRLAERLQTCNVRIVRNNGTTEMDSDLRTPLQVACLMQEDLSVSRVEYQFNRRWSTCYAT